MNLQSLFRRLFKFLESLIKNPNLYVAAVVGALMGGLAGLPIGFFAGGFIVYGFKGCHECIAYLNHQLYLDPSITLGSVIGMGLGAVLGGAIVSSITIYKVYKKTSLYPVLSPENMMDTLLGSFWISLEVAIGMDLGAIIGSLKLPGLGSVLGAVVGLTLMLFTTTLERKPIKS